MDRHHTPHLDPRPVMKPMLERARKERMSCDHGGAVTSRSRRPPLWYNESTEVYGTHT